MSKQTSRQLARLASDDNARAALVEHMRCAAGLLDGSAPKYEDAELQVIVKNSMARALRLAASRLCDHVRTSSDGTCRYCEAIVIDRRDDG